MNIKKRLLPAALIVILTVGCTILCRETRLLFFTALAVVSALEIEHVLEQAEMPVSKALLIMYVVGQGLLCYFGVPALWMLVWFGLAAPDGVRTEKAVFGGDRAAVRAQAVDHALGLLLSAADAAQSAK